MSKKQTISVLVENRAGVLNRITGLFSRRAFNIDSLAVGVTDDERVSRITIVADGSDYTLEQIEKQLNKLIDVIKVKTLAPDSMVSRELVLIKVSCTPKQRPEIISICELAHGKISDISANSLTIEMSDNKQTLDNFEELLKPYGIKEVVRTGTIAVQKGEATIIRLDGEKLGALIGRRGETMESLSYLASLVANRLEGDYIKLGLDVAGYRDKRESDLTALAQRIGAKVRKTGHSFAMEPMNPYERRIIHSAIGKMEGVRSESKGEGRDRRVVIYSTAPDAQTDNTYGERRPRGNGRRNGGNRNGGYRGNRNGDRNGGNRGGYRSGPRPAGSRGGRGSSVPERTYAPRDAEDAAPVAPKRTERVDDFADFSFGKIEI